MAEEGPLSDEYQMQEMPSEDYYKRTEINFLDSDGTLSVSHGQLTGGSSVTRDLAIRHERPWMHVDMSKVKMNAAADLTRKWMAMNKIQVLNVAGPRASKDPNIYQATIELLKKILEQADGQST